jgi:hypothetical protein
MKERLHCFKSWFLCLCLLLTASLVGCSDSPEGPSTYKISGKVTLDGVPVPAGKIVFSKEDTNARIACTIKDGYYENQDGKGHTGGKYEVQIEGRDGEATNLSYTGSLLWSGEWTDKIELQEASEEQDFNVLKSDMPPPPPIDRFDIEQT